MFEGANQRFRVERLLARGGTGFTGSSDGAVREGFYEVFDDKVFVLGDMLKVNSYHSGVPTY